MQTASGSQANSCCINLAALGFACVKWYSMNMWLHHLLVLSWAASYLPRRTSSSSALFPSASLELAAYDAQQGQWLPRHVALQRQVTQEPSSLGRQTVQAPCWAQNGRVWAEHLHCCIINSAWLQASQEESKAWSLPCPWLHSVAIYFLHIPWCFPQLLWIQAHVGTTWWHSWPAETTAYCAAQDHLCLPVLASLPLSTCFPTLSCITEKFTC